MLNMLSNFQVQTISKTTIDKKKGSVFRGPLINYDLKATNHYLRAAFLLVDS